jgi:putative Mg2+ transporter-C (MgtC) family protein
MLSPEHIVLRLIVEAVSGGLVGLERERLEWAAGLRTHALVCMGSALFMLVSSFGFADILDEENVVLDPSRVAAQVASGVGLSELGHYLHREIVKGLTTAASIWAVAAVGLTVGGGMLLAGVATTVLSPVILAFVRPVKKWLSLTVGLGS